MSLILGAIAVAGLAISAKQGSRSEKSLRSANRIRQVQSDVATMQERRNQIREARIRRGQILAAAGASGVSQSSSEMGAVSSIQSQLASNVGFLQGTRQRSNLISMYNQRSASSQSRQQMAGTVTNLALTSGGSAGIQSGAKSLFGG